MTMTETPHPAGQHTHRSDRGYGSVTRYWDDGSEVCVMTEDRAGVAIVFRPGRTDEGRLRPERGVYWEDHTPTRDWVLAQREAGAMPDHIYDFIRAELPHLDLEGP